MMHRSTAQQILLLISCLYAAPSAAGSVAVSIPTAQLIAHQPGSVVHPHTATLSQFYNHYKNSDIQKVQPLFSLPDLMGQIRLFAIHCQHQMSNQQAWIGSTPDQDFFNLSAHQPFKPYIQRVVRPTGSKTSLFGDLHGSIKSVLENLSRMRALGLIDDNFKIIDPDFSMISLGDIVDRGDYGADVLYVLMRLKNANLDRVFLIRGNHEDASINSDYGFEDELIKKFGALAVHKNKATLYRMYELMPVALILKSGDAAGLCAHGGFDVGCNLRPLRYASADKNYMWVGELTRADAIKKMPQSLQKELQRFPPEEVANFTPTAPTSPVTLGFMWWDFNDHTTNSGHTFHTRGRGWRCGQNLTQQQMKEMGIDIILRAHQHNGNMLKLLHEQHGMVSLWNGKVFTFLSAPSIDGFRYDSFAILTTGKTIDDWKLELNSVPVATPMQD